MSKGDRIIGTSNTKWTPGFEHCDKNYILPNINDPNYLPSVFEVCKRESISGILSFFDPDVVALSRQFDTFVEMGITPIIPRQEIAEICFDKYKTYQFLTEKGFNTAKTYLDFDTAMADIRSGLLSFPLFVKPRTGFGSALTFKAYNTLEVDAFFHYAPNMIIQEEMTGEAIDFDILNDLSGNVLSVVPWKKYRSRMGETEQAETFDDQNVIDFGVKLGTALGHIGPLDADLFLNGKSVSVLEINLRFGGGYPVSHLAGADFPSKIISMIKGQVINPSIGDYKRETVMMKDNFIIGGLKSDFFDRKIIDFC